LSPAPSSAHPPRLAPLCALAALGLSVLAFAPRLWLMREYLPGTFEWDRAHTFLLQCEQPFRRDIEPAMHWRLLPPLVAHTLGLRGWGALALPWLGAAAAALYVARLHAARLADWRFVFGGTLLFATTSAVLVPVGWLGLNDGWMWLGLIVVAFARNPWARLAACLLCPWVDERFLIGLPLALMVRQADTPAAGGWRALAPLAGVLPYAGLRLALARDPAAAQVAHEFLRNSAGAAPALLPWAPLAWWMGLRAAWLPAAHAVAGRPWLLGGGALATLAACLLVAADLSRSAAILCPLVLLGTFAFAARRPDLAPRAALTCGVANLLIPAAHITAGKLVRIDNLVLELFRLLRAP
jgi:hypothetical protein